MLIVYRGHMVSGSLLDRKRRRYIKIRKGEPVKVPDDLGEALLAEQPGCWEKVTQAPEVREPVHEKTDTRRRLKEEVKD